MSERFFIEPPVSGDRALLSGSEVHHLAGVMRAKAGDEISLFDGSGSEFTARILHLKKDRCELEIVERREISREPEVAVIAGVALPKGERQKWLVEKLTEFGVAELVPLLTTRGIAQPDERTVDKLRRTVIEACKQCGRNQLLAIRPPIEVETWFASPPASDLRLVAHPGHVNLKQAVSGANVQRIAFAVGPEGGFTDEEIAIAQTAGWNCVSLGKSILRIETAAIALAAQCVGLGDRSTSE